MAWADAVHEVGVALVLSYLCLLLLVEIQVLSCFPHVLRCFYSRDNSSMTNTLDSTLCAWSWMSSSSKFPISDAWRAPYTRYSRYLLRSRHLLTKPSRIHTYQCWCRRLVVCIDPVIILDSVDVLQYFPCVLIGLALDVFRCLQCSLLLDLVVFILVRHLIKCARARLILQSKSTADRMIDATSYRLILVSIRLVLTMAHICFGLCMRILLVSILVSLICNGSSHIWNAVHVEGALGLLMRRNWWLVYSWYMADSWNLVVTLWMNVDICVVVVDDDYLAAVG